MSCLALAEQFALRGIENHSAAIHAGERGIAEALGEITGTPVVLPQGRMARARAFHALCRKIKPDGVVMHFFTIDHVALALAARLAGVRRIVVALGNPAPAPGTASLARKVALILRLTRLVGAVLVSASRWIESTVLALGALPSGSRVVHNGCDVDAIAARAAGGRIGRDWSRAVIVTVARLDPIKDHATLFAAIVSMPAEIAGRTVHLDIVGDGMLRASLEAMASRLGIADRVTFAGARRDVAERLGAADVFCLPTTRDEGFGVVLIEALAAGVPVIASDVAACREVLEDGALGRLVPQGDPTVLAGELVAMLSAGAAVPETGSVKQRYGVSVMADGYLSALSLPASKAATEQISRTKLASPER